MQRWQVNVWTIYSGLSMVQSVDLGRSWTPPVVVEELAMRQEDEHTTVGVCDFTPGWHPQSGKLLGFGHTVRYQGGKLMKDPRPRETAWSAFDAEAGTWHDSQTITMPDVPEFYNSGNHSGNGSWTIRATCWFLFT